MIRLPRPDLGPCARHRPDPRCALVTGATSGIGAAFARALPRSTDLLLTGRDEVALGNAATELAEAGRTVEIAAADLTVPSDREALIARAAAQGIDLLINNAGAGRFGPVLEQSPAAQRATVELNVVAVTELTRALLPGMLERARSTGGRCGVIIVSSGSVLAPLPFLTTYVASKAFALYYAEGLAEELRGEPVDVLALLPGPTRSSFGARSGASLANVPGAPEPDTVARAALEALGRRTVLATGRAYGPAVDALLAPHRAAAAGMGQVMRLVGRRFME